MIMFDCREKFDEKELPEFIRVFFGDNAKSYKYPIESIEFFLKSGQVICPEISTDEVKVIINKECLVVYNSTKDSSCYIPYSSIEYLELVK